MVTVRDREGYCHSCSHGQGQWTALLVIVVSRYGHSWVWRQGWWHWDSSPESLTGKKQMHLQMTCLNETILKSQHATDVPNQSHVNGKGHVHSCVVL